MVLNHAPKFFLYPVAPVFEDLLKFVEDDDDITMVLRRDRRGRLQDFVQAERDGYAGIFRS